MPHGGSRSRLTGISPPVAIDGVVQEEGGPIVTNFRGIWQPAADGHATRSLQTSEGLPSLPVAALRAIAVITACHDNGVAGNRCRAAVSNGVINYNLAVVGNEGGRHLSRQNAPAETENFGLFTSCQAAAIGTASRLIAGEPEIVAAGRGVCPTRGLEKSLATVVLRPVKRKRVPTHVLALIRAAGLGRTVVIRD